MSKLDKAINYVLKVAQDEYGEQYETKTRQDRMTCIICGGKYSRQNKKVHVKSKKHSTRENKIRADIKREVLYSNNETKKKTRYDRDMERLIEINDSIPHFDIIKGFKDLEELENSKRYHIDSDIVLITDSTKESDDYDSLDDEIIFDLEIEDPVIMTRAEIILKAKSMIDNDSLRKTLSDTDISKIKKS